MQTTEESTLAKKIRQDMIANNPKAIKQATITRITAAQNKKIARDQILSTLSDIHNEELINAIRANLIDYAIRKGTLSERKAKETYQSALITAESKPSQSLLRIRIKIP